MESEKLPPSRPLVLEHDTTSLKSRVIGDQSWLPILTAYSFVRGGPTSMIQEHSAFAICQVRYAKREREERKGQRWRSSFGERGIGRASVRVWEAVSSLERRLGTTTGMGQTNRLALASRESPGVTRGDPRSLTVHRRRAYAAGSPESASTVVDRRSIAPSERSSGSRSWVSPIPTSANRSSSRRRSAINPGVVCQFCEHHTLDRVPRSAEHKDLDSYCGVYSIDVLHCLLRVRRAFLKGKKIQARSGT
ncbi:hypothetical protein DBV15_03680 [Temnothorax longispinosus]|uniref:Uncharacterized protein n=1 Tax=Temnothorax longispinosus TaxID=300112 RepID=A0A4S2KE93_9HYME|nr:hypothetical protein DBV15_03680 [Temnothorax longispinosus]